jgi:hypothetical protein
MISAILYTSICYRYFNCQRPIGNWQLKRPSGPDGKARDQPNALQEPMQYMGIIYALGVDVQKTGCVQQCPVPKAVPVPRCICIRRS